MRLLFLATIPSFSLNFSSADLIIFSTSSHYTHIPTFLLPVHRGFFLSFICFYSRFSRVFPSVPSPSPSLCSHHHHPAIFCPFTPVVFSLWNHLCHVSQPPLLSTKIPQNVHPLLVVFILLAHLFPPPSNILLFLPHPLTSIFYPNAGILEKEVTPSGHFLYHLVLPPFISLFPSLRCAPWGGQ